MGSQVLVESQVSGRSQVCEMLAAGSRSSASGLSGSQVSASPLFAHFVL